jgi:hypothetical protein
MSETSKKDSTNALPLIDIEEAINIVVTIHEKGLETEALLDVAKGCGFANATSTPFYRRIVAARLFGFLGSPKPGLTKQAWDYLKPDTDGAKQVALTQAIMSIKTYADIVTAYAGKKLNLDLLANKLEKDDTLSITKACAKVCAGVFVSSIKFAGFISADGTVVIPAGTTSSPVAAVLPVEPAPQKNQPKGEELEADEESQVQTLYLDNKRKRKITIKAPFAVTKEELERIRAWLGFQLIIQETIVNPEQQ